MRSRHAALIAAVVLLAAGGLLAARREAVFAWLHAAQHGIEGWVAAHPLPAALAYVAATALGKVTPFPGGLVMMLAGGFLFGALAGGLLAAAGAAASAGLVALAGRHWLRDAIVGRWGGRLSWIERAAARDGFNYLLALRLLPVVPAWLVNLLPVVAPIPLPRVLLATFLGLLPVSFIVASLGSRLSRLSEGAEALSAQALFQPGILLPLLALAALSLAPVIVRRYRERRR